MSLMLIRKNIARCPKCKNPFIEAMKDTVKNYGYIVCRECGHKKQGEYFEVLRMRWNQDSARNFPRTDAERTSIFGKKGQPDYVSFY